MELLHYNLTTKRLVAFCIDLMLLGLAGATWGFAVQVFAIEHAGWNNFVFYLLMSCILLKDLPFHEGSPGKKIMGIQLTVEADNLPLIRKVLRNLSLFVWPLELWVFLVTKNRLGDMMFYTRVDNKK